MTKHNPTKIIAEPGKQEVRIEREFDAPRELVYKAFTDPELVKQWWGPSKFTTDIVKFEPRTGGSWRFVQKDDQSEYGFHGVIHEALAGRRIVQTFEFEGVPGHVAMETATFEERGGKTLLITQSVFQSVEDRDGMVQSGMESGLVESHERLDELLEKMGQPQKQRA